MSSYLPVRCSGRSSQGTSDGGKWKHSRPSSRQLIATYLSFDAAGNQPDLHRRLQHRDGSGALPFQIIRAQPGQDHQVQREPKALITHQAAIAGLRENEGDLREHKKPDNPPLAKKQQIEKGLIQPSPTFLISSRLHPKQILYNIISSYS